MRLFGSMLGILLAAPLVVLAGDEKADPRVYAPDEKVEGKTQAEWSVVWWKWVLEIKKGRNPVLDKTGEFALAGQPGKVFLLAGNTGGVSKRKVKVPAGRPIFFAVINWVGNDPAKFDEKKLRKEIKEEMDRATGLEAVLDGKAIPSLTKHRQVSPVFEFTGPAKKEEALFEDGAGKQKAVSDGIWVMLKPLEPGKHTLRFTGSNGEKGEKVFNLDVTFELTVVDAEKERP